MGIRRGRRGDYQKEPASLPKVGIPAGLFRWHTESHGERNELSSQVAGDRRSTAGAGRIYDLAHEQKRPIKIELNQTK